jgi:hypothetical protein
MTNFHDNPVRDRLAACTNVRVMRNMMINSASHALLQSAVAWRAVYWMRNIAYHLPGVDASDGGSAGVLFYNNTILSETAAQGSSNVHWRNNLFSGRELGTGDLLDQHVHQLFLVGLQRVQCESRRRGAPSHGTPPPRVSADFSGLLATGPAGCARTGDASVPDARRLQRRDRSETGTACCVDYDVFVQGAEARRAGSRDRAEGVRPEGRRLSA